MGELTDPTKVRSNSINMPEHLSKRERKPSVMLSADYDNSSEGEFEPRRRTRHSNGAASVLAKPKAVVAKGKKAKNRVKNYVIGSKSDDHDDDDEWADTIDAQDIDAQDIEEMNARITINTNELQDAVDKSLVIFKTYRIQ